ncbi:MAG: Rnf-Nqr domain containing protein [Bilophila wadsworthia]
MDRASFRLVLGCARPRRDQTADNGLGMGLAVTFARALQHAHSAGARHHPQKSASSASSPFPRRSWLPELLMQAYAYPLYQKLGIFVPLIVVNCIIGPGRSLRRQKHGPARHRGRSGHRLHVPDFPCSIREVFGAERCSGRR